MPTTVRPPQSDPTQSHWPSAATSLFRCPACGGPFGADFACENCGNTVVTDDGILDFVAGTSTTKLDDIDYDEVYSIDHDHSAELYQGLQRVAGTLWTQDFGSALEIGCGTGGLSMALFSQIRTNAVVLTDISPKMLRICRDRLTHNIQDKAKDFLYATFSGTESCFTPDSFDSCFGTAVVHHITDVPAFLRQVYTLLKPGGLAFFMEPVRGFHSALTATLADIISVFIRNDTVAELDRSLMLNWMAEVHCNITNSGDIEVLAGREDKHYFIADEFLAWAEDAGFRQPAALICDPDPAGTHTIQAYLAQYKLSPQAASELAKAWPAHQQHYFGPLAASDRSPSYLFWMRKPTGPGKTGQSARPPQPAPEPRRSHLHIWLHLQLENTREGRQIIVKGWCVTDIPTASLQITIGTEKYRLPIYLPRPDVHQVINAKSDFPAICSLSSGIADTIDLPIGRGRGTNLELTFQVILANHQVVDAGSMTLRPGQGRQVHHNVIPP